MMKTLELDPNMKHENIYYCLYFQALVATVIGVLLGHLYPSLGENMKPLGGTRVCPGT